MLLAFLSQEFRTILEIFKGKWTDSRIFFVSILIMVD